MRIVDIRKCLLLVTLVISGCGNPATLPLLNTTGSASSHLKSLPIEQKTLKGREQVERSLADDNLEKAQKCLADLHHTTGAELRLQDLYITVINRLLIAAKRANKSDQPEKAGRLFMLAKQIYPNRQQLQSTIALSPDEIDNNIQQCADKVMKNGLIAYRSGDLSNAINIWTDIDRFLPNHKPSLIAVSTARQQLQSLGALQTGDTQESAGWD